MDSQLGPPRLPESAKKKFYQSDPGSPPYQGLTPGLYKIHQREIATVVLRCVSRAVEESKFCINETDIRPRRLDVQINIDVICNSHIHLPLHIHQITVNK